jgi:hypothetical protein
MTFEKLGLPEGPWHYRPHGTDDWGVVRGAPDPNGVGIFIIQARYPYCDETELAKHRRNMTDPYEKLARAIASIPDMMKEIESNRHVIEALDKENAHLRALLAKTQLSMTDSES